jgi:hypothetical protein
MACVECAYGTAGSVKHHSYLGQKVGSGKTATKYWGGKFFKSKTKEEYTVGVHTTITDAFRAYDSMQQCVYNYYELLNTKLYSRVQKGVDYRTQMAQIKMCGYMTSSTEVNSVIKLIEKYNLVRFDSAGGDASPVAVPIAFNSYMEGATYITQANLYVRKAPNGEALKMSDLTKNALEHAYDKNGSAILKRGTKVTCKEVTKVPEGSTWIRIPSGWICAIAKDGKVYIS